MFLDEYDGFDELRASLDRLPDQTDGDAAAICQTGEMYEEFFHVAIAREADIKAVERMVVKEFSRQIGAYLGKRHGRIYWRKRLETDISPYEVVVKFDDVNGPDVDFVTNRRCFKDKAWFRVACYCRLYRATNKTLERVDKVA